MIGIDLHYGRLGEDGEFGIFAFERIDDTFTLLASFEDEDAFDCFVQMLIGEGTAFTRMDVQ